MSIHPVRRCALRNPSAIDIPISLVFIVYNLISNAPTSSSDNPAKQKKKKKTLNNSKKKKKPTQYNDVLFYPPRAREIFDESPVGAAGNNVRDNHIRG